MNYCVTRFCLSWVISNSKTQNCDVRLYLCKNDGAKNKNTSRNKNQQKRVQNSCNDGNTNKRLRLPVPGAAYFPLLENTFAVLMTEQISFSKNLKASEVIPSQEKDTKS